MNLLKLLAAATIFSIIPGQLIRLSLGPYGAITVSDIFVALSGLVFFFYCLIYKKTPRIIPTITYIACLFMIWALTTVIFALNFFNLTQILVALSFLIRFAAYFLFTVMIFNIVPKILIIGWIKLLLVSGVLFTTIGFAQLLLFPDLSFLANYGWDPHQTRIVSTVLDPNFAGGLFTIFLSFSLSLFIFKKRLIFAFLAAFFFAATILTFSRSAYLAFLTSILTIGILKSPKTLIIAALLFASAFFIIPQVRIRILGAFTVDETAQARIESWQKAIKIFAKNPIFGVGFNTYRFAQEKYGYFDFDSPKGGHSGAGSDSSVLLVAATTGIFGFVFFAAILISIFKLFARDSKKSFVKLASNASFLGLLVHSQFVNSLFFPQIMLILFFIVAVAAVEEK